MMTSRRLLNYANAEPFRAFRIKMASGEAFEIPHPETVFVGQTTARVFTSEAEGDEQPQEREQEISILLIESVEVAESASQQDHRQNGNS